MKRLKAVIIKEFAHILRDPTSLIIILFMPILMMFVFGHAINFDLQKVETGVIDFSQGEHSQQLIEKFAHNKYFVLTDLRLTSADPIATGEAMLKSGALKEVLIIPVDFSKKIANGQKTEVGIIIDGSDSNVANLVYQYNELILLDFMAEHQKIEWLLKLNTKIYFNPEAKSVYFFIPGIVALLLIMISAMLTSISIAREKESGSIDLIFISPLKSYEIIIGKTIPYIFVALLDGTLILLYGKFWFGLPFHGSIMTLLVFSLLYIITGLSLGILISTIAPTQKVAMFATLLITMLPSVMLSGFIFPLDSMGWLLRAISHIVPAMYFLKIIRGVVLKGAELRHFFIEGLSLLIFSIILLTISSIKFNQNRMKSR